MNNKLSNFTDIFGDEICDSQPLSLPSSNEPDIQGDNFSRPNRPPKCTGQRGNFRSIEEIDSKYRHVFSYPYFNFVQSSVIEDALYSDKSIVVCAPTGSGKTVVFEMAIVQLLMELEDENYTDDFKIIYMAPVKALCNERLTEWYPKFTKLGLLCIEVTGDTEVDFPQLKPYRIIITTPEKWDMLTRRWKDHKGLVEVVKLFLIDEVHILNDQLRGPVLEAVVSRMKTIESSAQSAHRIEQLQAQYQGTEIKRLSAPRIRFVAVSATVSNPEDVATWLGNVNKPAVYHKFGDECRPVNLKRVVEGYPCSEGTSIFKFDIILNYKLWPIIQKYHNGKPTLIFCNTRKSVALTAETPSREITVSFSPEQKAKLTALASTIKNKKIQTLVLSGVGCHHAGLLFEERTSIEQAFRNRDLPILITTTTLAMGVNLPAHLVIIKNTQQYVNGAYQEYSISTILQMVGRAGRPQFDTEATAVIMTRLQDKARYQALVGGSEPLQSYLHKRLPENLNSEAALGTVGDVAQCVQWLNSTFLSVRAVRDPKRYLGLPNAASPQLIMKKIEELCVIAMNGLASAGLISMDEASCIESTEAGRLMSIYYLDLETMKLIMKIEGSESLERLLWLVCESHELSDMHLRADERRCLNALNRSQTAAAVRFPMKGKITTRQMKLSCIIQAVLGCIPIPDPSLNQEAMKIMRIADRVSKCLVSYLTRHNLISQCPKFFSAILNSLILAKCLSAHLWENSPYVSKQLKGIGPTFSALLASAGKVNFMLLEEAHPRDLERIMNKGPPAGNVLRKQISLLPKYNLTMTPIDEKTVRIQLSLLNHAHLAENLNHLAAGASHKSYIVVGDSENYILLFTSFKESDLISVYDGCMTFQVTRKQNNEHKVIAHCISSTFVGIDEQCEYVFKSINQFSPTVIKESEYFINDSIKTDSPRRQSLITDTFKERKRKTNEQEITQCKEKKKRESNLIEKFNLLKESFGKTTEGIKSDLNNTAQRSNSILQNLIQPNQHFNNNVRLETGMNATNTMEIGNKTLQNILHEELDCDESLNDDQVCNILNDIEKEIQCNKSLNVQNQTPKNSTGLKEGTKYEPTYSYKYGSAKSARKKLKSTNNYTFLDVLEKKVNSSDEYECSESKCDTGFSDAVKCQIEKYLQRTNKNIKIKDAIVDLIEPSNKSFKKSPVPIKDIKDSLTDIAKYSDQKNNKIVIDDNEKDYLLDNELPAIEFKYDLENENKAHDQSLDNHLENNETSNINTSCQIIPYTDTMAENIPKSLQNNESISHCNFRDNDVIDPKKFIKYQKLGSSDPTLNKISFNQSDFVQKASTQSVDPKSTLLNFPLRLHNIEDSTNLNIQKYNITNSGQNHIQNQDPYKINLPEKCHKDVNSTAVHRTSFDNINETTDRRLEYVKKYSYSKSQAINIVSNKAPNKQIHIIGNLKVNLDVIELTYNNKNDNKSNIKEKSECNFDATAEQEQHNLPIQMKNMKQVEIKSCNIDNLKILPDQHNSTNKHRECFNADRKDIIDFNRELDTRKIINKYKNRDCHNSDQIDSIDFNKEPDTEDVINNYKGGYCRNLQQIDSFDFNKARDTEDIINKYDAAKTSKTEECCDLNINYNLKENQTQQYKNNNKTVKDILNKYKDIAKRQNNTDNYDNNNIRLFNASPEHNNKNNILMKPTRKYRISDLDKLEVTLPESIIVGSQTFQQFPLQDNVNEKKLSEIRASITKPVCVVSNNCTENIIYTNTGDKIKFVDNEDDILKVPSPISNFEQPTADDINNAVLDPKALLHSLNNIETTDIIPPPADFCDDVCYSPVHCSNLNDDLINIDDVDNDIQGDDDMINDLRLQNATSTIYQFNEVFDDSFQISPSREIETWTLSRDDDKYDSSIANINKKAFTITRKNTVETNPITQFQNSRLGKLSHFKFKRKDVLKK